jgi:nucleotide-binding universal stress UspA family protein
VVDVAAALARQLRASLVLVHALDMATDDPGGELGPSAIAHAAMAARIAERKAEATQSLDATCARLTSGGGLEVSAQLVEERPFAALTSVAASKDNAWIVVGARAGRSVLGRTVDQVLRQATVTVVVVPDGATWSDTGPVLAGIDAGALDAEVLRTASALARHVDRRLGIVHVRTTGDEGAMLRVMSHAREVAPEIAASATISVMRVEHSVARTVAEHARRIHAGLVVIGTHARRTLERWMLGSTAEALVHAADVPFLVVRES